MLGSAARREFTLGSDQENALAYADADAESGVDAYFERFAQDVNAGLERCGFVPDLNGVLARNRLWRMGESAWIKVFRDCLTEPDNSHLIRATVSFDFRHAMRRARDRPAADCRDPRGSRASGLPPPARTHRGRPQAAPALHRILRGRR